MAVANLRFSMLSLVNLSPVPVPGARAGLPGAPTRAFLSGVENVEVDHARAGVHIVTHAVPILSPMRRTGMCTYLNVPIMSPRVSL